MFVWLQYLELGAYIIYGWAGSFSTTVQFVVVVVYVPTTVISFAHAQACSPSLAAFFSFCFGYGKIFPPAQKK